MTIPEYSITSSTITPERQGLWVGSAWAPIKSIDIASFRPEGSSHKPQTQCKLQYDKNGLYGIFRVEDQYMRCVHTTFQSDVYRDSCVEIFLQPTDGRGYFNFEFNCLGVLKASYITDPTKIKGQIKTFTDLDTQDDAQIQRYHSLEVVPDSEADSSITWYLEFFIPLNIFEKYLDSPVQMEAWRGNLFKCGDETSHPHWASWAPVPLLNFHLPESFGVLEFSSQ